MAPLDANGAARLVRALRRRLGPTLEELAHENGVSFSMLSFRENGRRQPFLRRDLNEMARVAGVIPRPDKRGRRRGQREGGR